VDCYEISPFLRRMSMIPLASRLAAARSGIQIGRPVKGRLPPLGAVPPVVPPVVLPPRTPPLPVVDVGPPAVEVVGPSVVVDVVGPSVVVVVVVVGPPVVVDVGPPVVVVVPVVDPAQCDSLRNASVLLPVQETDAVLDESRAPDDSSW